MLYHSLDSAERLCPGSPLPILQRPNKPFRMTQSQFRIPAAHANLLSSQGDYPPDEHSKLLRRSHYVGDTNFMHKHTVSSFKSPSGSLKHLQSTLTTMAPAGETRNSFKSNQLQSISQHSVVPQKKQPKHLDFSGIL